MWGLELRGLEVFRELEQCPRIWVLEVLRYQERVLDKASSKRRMLLYCLDRDTEACAKGEAVRNGARDCIRRESGRIMDTAWWLQHNPLQCTNCGVLCRSRYKLVWMCSPLGAFPEDEEPCEWEWDGAGVGAHSQYAPGARIAPSSQAGSVPSLPSSPGSGL